MRVRIFIPEDFEFSLNLFPKLVVISIYFILRLFNFELLYMERARFDRERRFFNLLLSPTFDHLHIVLIIVIIVARKMDVSKTVWCQLSE